MTICLCRILLYLLQHILIFFSASTSNCSTEPLASRTTCCTHANRPPITGMLLTLRSSQHNPSAPQLTTDQLYNDMGLSILCLCHGMQQCEKVRCQNKLSFDDFYFIVPCSHPVLQLLVFIVQLDTVYTMDSIFVFVGGNLYDYFRNGGAENPMLHSLFARSKAAACFVW